MTPSKASEMAREIVSHHRQASPGCALTFTEKAIEQAILQYHAEESKELVEAKELESRRLNWLDLHCSFVADEQYKIGPFKVGELRKLADAGIEADHKKTTLRLNLGQG